MPRARLAPLALSLFSLVSVACGSAPAPSAATAPAASASAAPAVPEGQCALEDGLLLTTSDDPTLGDVSAPITIVFFGDLDDAGTAQMLPLLLQVLNDFGPEQLRVVWKHMPMPGHAEAQPAAEAAQAALALGGQDAFWLFVAMALDEPLSLERDSYVAWAAQAGVQDAAAFTRALDDHAYAKQVSADAALGLRVGVGSAPSLLINGKLVPPTGSIERLRAHIGRAIYEMSEFGRSSDAACALARKEVASREPVSAPTPAPVDRSIWKVPVAGSPSLGSPDALVTMVVFSDYECPYCKRAESTIEALRASYGKDLRIVWKDNPLPFHKRAMPAATLAREARAKKGDEGFWQAHDALFAVSPDLSEETLLGIAQKIGLDPAATSKALSSDAHTNVIEDDMLLADDFKASGTPYFFINGRRISGAKRASAFRAIIDEELTRAREALARGVEPSKLYAELTRDGEEPPPPTRKQIPAPPKGAPFRGNANARVVIQEFSDYQCPFCRRVEPTIDRLVKEYGKQIKVVFRQRPLAFHPDAQLAAEASLEALAQRGQSGFWKMHEQIFAGQKTEDGLKQPALEAYAKAVGLNVSRFQKALETHKHAAAVEADAQIAEQFKFNGTPSFVINDIVIVGAQPYARFRHEVERALAEVGQGKPLPSTRTPGALCALRASATTTQRCVLSQRSHEE